MKNSWSLASRLTLWFTTSAFFLILIATITLYWSLARTLNIEDAHLMSDKIQTVIHLLNADPNLKSIKERVEKEWVTRKFERVYVKVLDQNGTTITETPDFDDISKTLFEGVPTVNFDHPEKAAERKETKTGKVFTVEVIRVLPSKSSPQERIVQIALDRTREKNFLATYRSQLIIVLCVTLLVAMLIGKRIALKGIQPISEIAETVKKIRSTTLHEHINVFNVPAELTLLAKTFNEMLDRLNESFDRLSRFSQDIAHDLRTPINNLQGALEVALGRPRSSEEYLDVIGSCLEECARLSHLIDNLLFITRAENPSAQLAIETLDIKNEIERLTDFFEAPATEAGVKLHVDVPNSLSIRADRALLQRAIGNLITNAVKYTKREGQITLSARTVGGAIQIEVKDTGVGIPADHLSKVFDRFYRVDESRSANPGGSGLGLSIVKSIMSLHRGKVELSSQVGEGTTVNLTFPSV